MRRILTAVLLLASACGQPSNEFADSSADLAAIDSLHEADVASVRARDIDALLNLWSDNPIALPPEGPILEGREAIAGMLEPNRSGAERLWETVEYVQNFTEVEVAGTYAWDLGTVTTRMVRKSDGRELTLNGKLLRILRREPDGSWRVHRSAWNTEPPIFSDPGTGS